MTRADIRRRHYEKRRDAGLCVAGGCDRPALVGVHCSVHAEQNRARAQAARRAKLEIYREKDRVRGKRPERRQKMRAAALRHYHAKAKFTTARKFKESDKYKAAQLRWRKSDKARVKQRWNAWLCIRRREFGGVIPEDVLPFLRELYLARVAFGVKTHLLPPIAPDLDLR